jgi:DNA-binding transcriptional ArsR family regulator
MSKKSATQKNTAQKPAKRPGVPKKAVVAKSPKGSKRPAAPGIEADGGKALENKVSKKAIQELLSKGKKQGFLTYDEINELLPEDMLSPEQIDETLMLFDDNGIEVVDEKQNKKIVKLKSTAESKIVNEEIDGGDYGSVTDPVKMYLREMGMVTLLSREGEVEIAKKIEASCIRVDIDDTSATLQKKIREAEQEWVPYIVVIGEKEIESSMLAVRDRESRGQQNLTVDDLLAGIHAKIDGKPFKALPLPRSLSKRPQFHG